MSQPYVGEIRMFAGNFPPSGWMFCEGQQLAIGEHEMLFQVVGTTYGGDGVNTFALPDMRGRIPVHPGPGDVLGQSGGTEQVTLRPQEMPAHGHPFLGSASNALQAGAANRVVAQPTVMDMYRANPPSAAIAKSISEVGGNQPHDNVQPFLCVDFIISLSGIFPVPVPA